jgi:hypothetical protein
MLIATRIEDRRTHERQACRLWVYCRPHPDRSWVRWPGRMVDISRGGVGLRLAGWFEEGTLVRAYVEPRPGDAPFSLLLRVLNVNPLPSGEWQLGCQIIPPLSAEDLTRFLDQFGA